MKCRPLNVIGYMRLFGFLWKEVTNAKSFNSAQFPSPHQLNAITDSKTHNTALINYNTKEKQTNKQTNKANTVHEVKTLLEGTRAAGDK